VHPAIESINNNKATTAKVIETDLQKPLALVITIIALTGKYLVNSPMVIACRGWLHWFEKSSELKSVPVSNTRFSSAGFLFPFFGTKIMVPAETDDPFGHTFFSEIDVVQKK
jgi:hypothetical protein